MNRPCAFAGDPVAVMIVHSTLVGQLICGRRLDYLSNQYHSANAVVVRTTDLDQGRASSTITTLLISFLSGHITIEPYPFAFSSIGLRFLDPSTVVSRDIVIKLDGQ